MRLSNTGVDVLAMVAGLMDTQGEALARYPKWQLADPNDAAAQTQDRSGTGTWSSRAAPTDWSTCLTPAC